MAHPFNEKRADKVQKSRVGKIVKGYATGGGVHSDEAEDRKLIRKEVKKSALRADGGSVKARADKVSRAKGGRIRSKGTNINVIIAPSGEKPPMAGLGPMPPAPPMAAPPMPPKPPMMPPSPGAMGPPPGMGGMPMMPPRSDGGRAYKKGGAVKDKMSGEKKHGKKVNPFKMRASGGAVSDSSKGGTQVQHSGNKSDAQNIGRGPVITRATGGPIYANGAKGKQMAWLKGKGAGGGKGRLAKAAHEGGHEPWLKDAAS